LLTRIAETERFGTWLPEWDYPDRFLWFVNHREKNEPNCDYQAITRRKIEQCPEALRKIIGWK
jgi:hypothetical protein